MPTVIERYIASFDELHTGVLNYSEAIMHTPDLTREEKHDLICDFILDFLIDSYLLGIYTGGEYFLGYKAQADADRMKRLIDLKIDGKTFRDRVDDHIREDSPGMIANLADTEYHRIFNEGEMDAARQYEKATGKHLYKTWRDVGDERVRDTHRYLGGVSVRLEQKFHTFDGDEAMAPGGFKWVENNAGCRCWLEISTEKS